MKISFYGAAHEVTGSCFHLNACGKNIFIDCGMKQGADFYDSEELPVAPNAVDYLILTHAHIDHSGNIPLIFSQGFKGEIHTTDATTDLCEIMLRDSAHIQEFEAEWKNRKNKRAGKEEYLPKYTMDDAINCLKLFVEHEYENEFQLCEGIKVKFVDAGHLLGSASVEISVEEEGSTEKIVFSGDIGNTHQPLIHDPTFIKEADYVVMESTYGDRLHGESPDYAKELSLIIEKTLARGGNVVIPSFAVGRTQEILYFIRKIKADKLIKSYDFPVYVDSPLAIEATNIYKERFIKYFDEEAIALIEKGINPINFDNLNISTSSDESKLINYDRAPKVIISASGMCDAGRIKHHLKHNLWREECTILFVGFQANGTLGRKILEGAKSVKLFGEEIEVKAEIHSIQGISAHADKNGLINWISAFENKPKKVFIVHGQDDVVDSFSEMLKTEYGQDTFAPYPLACYDLQNNIVLDEGKKDKVGKREFDGDKEYIRANGTYARLMLAGKRINDVIKHNAGGTNKDLAKFADQINSLCEKWDR